MKKKAAKVIVMGGSWGGIQASLAVLKELPPAFKLPVVLVLHRLRNFEGSLQEVLGKRLEIKVVEVEDKQPLQRGCVHLAPSNYHVLIENDGTFSLDDSELENFSRPSIDVTFRSASDVYGDQLIGILLSGASKDGSAGLKYIADNGGITIVQDPQEAEIDTMPLAAIRLIPECRVMNTASIHQFLLSIHDH